MTAKRAWRLLASLREKWPDAKPNGEMTHALDTIDLCDDLSGDGK
jgi:hypothetical protein